MMSRGLAGEGQGDHHPLAHAPAEVVRVLLEAPLRLADADHPEELDRSLIRALLAEAQMEHHGLRELQTDGQHRIERGHGLLEHHGDLAAAHTANCVIAHREQIPAPETDRAAFENLAGRMGDETQNRHCADRLAAAGLSDNRDRLALAHMVRDPVDGLDGTLGGVEIGTERLDFQQLGHVVLVRMRELSQFRPTTPHPGRGEACRETNGRSGRIESQRGDSQLQDTFRLVRTLSRDCASVIRLERVRDPTLEQVPEFRLGGNPAS